MRRWPLVMLTFMVGCATPPQEEPAAPGVAGSAEASPPASPEVQARAQPAIVAPPVAVPPTARAEDLERLLVYFEHIRKLPSAELTRENESARASFTRSRSDFDRLRLAMLLSVPNTAIADEQRAYELLDPVVKNPASPLHGLALLMSTHLQERRRLEGSNRELQQNVQGLQNKLDALMSLERTLMDRDKSTPPRKR